MVYVDMTRPDREMTPGIDLWSVVQCVSKDSRSGDPMLAIKFARISDPNDHVYDNIMLGGNGWGIGKQKLAGLGIGADFKGEIDPVSFVEAQVWVATAVDQYQGKDRLKVDIQELEYAGYQPRDMVPSGKVLPDETVTGGADGTPF